jgi:chromosome segregation ATPase
MGRVKDEPRGTLAALQDMLTGGSQALVEQALTIGEGVQRRLADVGRGVEGQVLTLFTSLEETLAERFDAIVSALSVSIRKDLDRMRERIRALENRLADVPKEGLRELVAPVQAIAEGASERAATALARAEENVARIQSLERRTAEVARERAQVGLDSDEVRIRLDRLDQRLTDLGREVGTKLGELGALRERFTRLETRVVDNSKDQIARAGEAAGLRDRMARLEARLSDLSKEQLARAVETAGLRERVFRLEQRNGGPTPPITTAEQIPAGD